ncbi:MAG: immunity 26/phosphotriesterase HocA family protein [Acinetobacter guillouiae]
MDQVINDDKFNTFKNYLAIWNYILMVNQKRRRRIKEGDVFGIELDDSLYGYGVVLNSILMGFYELKTKNLEQDLNRIVSQKILFKVCVMKYAFKSKKWNFIDNYAVSDELKEQVYFFKQDPLIKVFPCILKKIKIALNSPQHMKR